MWISNALNYFITCSCPLSPWFQMWPQLFHHHFPIPYYFTVMYIITLSKAYTLWNTYTVQHRRIQYQNKICFLSLMTTSHTTTSFPGRVSYRSPSSWCDSELLSLPHPVLLKKKFKHLKFNFLNFRPTQNALLFESIISSMWVLSQLVVSDFATLWTVDFQAPLSMGFSR